MKKTIRFSIISFILILSCHQSNKKELASKIYNEGLKFTIDAVKLNTEGMYEESNKKAINRFLKAYELDSSNIQIINSLGQTYYDINDIENAQYWLNKAIKKDSNLAGGLITLGLCNIQLGHIQRAQDLLNRAFKIDTSKNISFFTARDIIDLAEKKYNQGIEKEKQGNKIESIHLMDSAITILKIENLIDITDSTLINKIKYIKDQRKRR